MQVKQTPRPAPDNGEEYQPTFRSSRELISRSPVGLQQHDPTEPLLVSPDAEPSSRIATTNVSPLRSPDDDGHDLTSHGHVEPIHKGTTEINQEGDRDETSTLLPGSKTERRPEESSLLNVSWRPFWLRRRIFGIFIVIYLSFAAAISALTAYSSTHNGIVDQGANQSLEYIWKFGLTAGTTIPYFARPWHSMLY